MHRNPNNRLQILLVNEINYTSDSVVTLLSRQGYDVFTASGRKEALKILTDNKFHLVLVGINLRDGNGYALCRQIIEIHGLPVIFISANTSEENVVSAFDVGADDFIALPFREREFICRIHNTLRKSDINQSILYYKDIRVDTVKGHVTKNGKEVYLSSLEYRILLVFMSNQGKILSRQNLLEQIWAVDGNYINDNTLTVYIKRIREKLEDKPSSPKFIKTVRGKGYKTGD